MKSVSDKAPTKPGKFGSTLYLIKYISCSHTLYAGCLNKHEMANNRKPGALIQKLIK